MGDSTSQFQLAPDDGGQDEGKISFLIPSIALVVIIVAILLFQVFKIDGGTKPTQLTEEQKLEALSKLSSNESVASLSDKEKLSILGRLSDNKNTGTVVLSEEEKLKILRQLSD